MRKVKVAELTIKKDGTDDYGMVYFTEDFSWLEEDRRKIEDAVLGGRNEVLSKDEIKKVTVCTVNGDVSVEIKKHPEISRRKLIEGFVYREDDEEKDKTENIDNISDDKPEKSMKIYLDNCCFNRPYDDQSSLTVRLETEAKLDIQEKIRSGQFSLGWSYILDFENNANPFSERRAEIQRWKELADSFVSETEEILLKMNELISADLKPADALHIACAVSLQCRYFLTVDKGILKKMTKHSEIKIINPVNFIMEWEAWQ
jgi:hypothetical protein